MPMLTNAADRMTIVKILFQCSPQSTNTQTQDLTQSATVNVIMTSTHVLR